MEGESYGVLLLLLFSLLLLIYFFLFLQKTSCLGGHTRSNVNYSTPVLCNNDALSFVNENTLFICIVHAQL